MKEFFFQVSNEGNGPCSLSHSSVDSDCLPWGHDGVRKWKTRSALHVTNMSIPCRSLSQEDNMEPSSERVMPKCQAGATFQRDSPMTTDTQSPRT